MRKISAKIAVIVLSIGITLGVSIGAKAVQFSNANAVPVTPNPFAAYNLNNSTSEAPIGAATGNINPTNQITGYTGPDTTPDRKCILFPPLYLNPVDDGDPNTNPAQSISTAWYNDVFLTYVNEYILNAQDMDSDGINDGLFSVFTEALTYNTFNNFCFNAGQEWNQYTGQPTLQLYEGNEVYDSAGAKHTGTNSLGNIFPVVSEQKFLVATVCEDPNPLTPTNEAYDLNPQRCGTSKQYNNLNFSPLDNYYSLTDAVDVNPGDVVRFGVYVHNNALYALSNGIDGTAVADDVLIEFDTTTDPTKPRAGISSPDNSYYEDPFNPTPANRILDTLDLDGDGNTSDPLRIATDTTTLNSPTPFNLSPIESGTWVYNSIVQNDPANQYQMPWSFQSGSSVQVSNYGNGSASTFNMTLDPSIHYSEHELEINQVAGCFEFSGWYFFDYMVEDEPVPLCEDLDITWMQQWPTYEVLPVIRDEFIDPNLADPPIPVGFSDGDDEGLYLVGETAVPLAVQIDRNGYEGDIRWELLDSNLQPYQPNVEHFCSNVAMGQQTNACVLGTVLSDGGDLSSIVTNPNSTLGNYYQQDTFKLYNLNPGVVLRIYATDSAYAATECKEALFFPACQGMNLLEPQTATDLTLDLTTGIEIEVETVPEYFNGPIVFETNNECGVFDIDDSGADFTDDPNPVDSDGDNMYEVQVEYSATEPKTVWYNIDQTEPGCSADDGANDFITIYALGDKGQICQETLSFAPPVQACYDLEITSPSVIVCEDNPTLITTDITPSTYTGSLLWSSTNPTTTFDTDPNCSNPTPTLNTTVDGIGGGLEAYVCSCDELTSIDVELVGEEIACNDSLSTLGSEEELCTYLGLITNPTPIYIEDGSSSFDSTIIISGGGSWAGSALEVMLCSDPTTLTSCQNTLDQSAEITINSNPSGSTVTGQGTPRAIVSNVQDGNVVTATATNISNLNASIAAFVVGAPLCQASDSFLYCGDGNPNGPDDTPNTPDDEECDDGNNEDGDGCSSTCEEEEDGEEPLKCTELEIGSPDIITCEQNPTLVELTVAPLDYVGDVQWTSTSPNTLFDTDPNCTNPIEILTTTLDGNGGGLEAYVCSCDGATGVAVEAVDSPDQCSDSIGSYCGDGTLDTDGADDTPGTSDDEQCDDGNNVGGDGCSASCTDEGGSTPQRCIDLNIVNSSSITSFPALIQIQTVPFTWGIANGASFRYSSSNPNGTFLRLSEVGTTPPAGARITTDKSMYYFGEIGDTVTVYETQQTGACVDTLTFSEDGGNGCVGDDCDGGGGGGGGGGGDGGGGGGGSSCPGLEIISPSAITNPMGTLEILAPRGTLIDAGANSWNGPFTYFSVDNNVLFVDLENTEDFIALNNQILSGNLDGTIGTDIIVSTTSKEIFYYVVDENGTPVTEVIDRVVIYAQDAATSGDAFCTDYIRNSFTPEYDGPRLEKFGWIHPTGGNTTSEDGHDVNYQITYYSKGSDTTHITITDTIGLNNGRVTGNLYINDYVDWSPTNDNSNNGINLGGTSAIEPGVDTWYYGIGLHWIQTGNDTTWNGHENQIPECNLPSNMGYDQNGQLVEIETGLPSISPANQGSVSGATIQPTSVPTHRTIGNLCYEGRIDSPGGIEVYNIKSDTVFNFEYEGIFHAPDFFYSCGENDPAGTQFFYNYAIAEQQNGAPVDYSISDTEILYTTCNYTLTRNGGDVLFYDAVDTGSNLSALQEDNVRNSDGLVMINRIITNTISNILAEGPSGDLTPSMCDNTGFEEIPNSMSSFICQIFIDLESTNQSWSPEKIEEETNFDYLNGFVNGNTHYIISDLDPSSSSMNSIQVNTPNGSGVTTRGKVYKIDQSTKLNSLGSGQIVIPEQSGAMTFIIDGDLEIYNNIVYASDSGASNHELSSIAFIVEGNIIIHPNVTTLSGVYIAKKRTDENGVVSGGNINGMSASTSNQLVIHGSVFGDLQGLINSRSYSGAPSMDGGNIVIRYDSRVLRNTPSGLKDQIDMKWLKSGRQPLSIPGN